MRRHQVPPSVACSTVAVNTTQVNAAATRPHESVAFIGGDSISEIAPHALGRVHQVHQRRVLPDVGAGGSGGWTVMAQVAHTSAPTLGGAAHDVINPPSAGG